MRFHTLSPGRLAGVAAIACASALIPVAALAAPAAPPAKTVPACGSSLLTWFAPTGDGFTGGAGIEGFLDTGGIELGFIGLGDAAVVLDGGDLRGESRTGGRDDGLGNSARVLSDHRRRGER